MNELRVDVDFLKVASGGGGGGGNNAELQNTVRQLGEQFTKLKGDLENELKEEQNRLESLVMEAEDRISSVAHAAGVEEEEGYRASSARASSGMERSGSVAGKMKVANDNPAGKASSTMTSADMDEGDGVGAIPSLAPNSPGSAAEGASPSDGTDLISGTDDGSSPGAVIARPSSNVTINIDRSEFSKKSSIKPADGADGGNTGKLKVNVTNDQIIHPITPVKNTSSVSDTEPDESINEDQELATIGENDVDESNIGDDGDEGGVPAGASGVLGGLAAGGSTPGDGLDDMASGASPDAGADDAGDIPDEGEGAHFTARASAAESLAPTEMSRGSEAVGGTSVGRSVFEAGGIPSLPGSGSAPPSGITSLAPPNVPTISVQRTSDAETARSQTDTQGDLGDLASDVGSDMPPSDIGPSPSVSPRPDGPDGIGSGEGEQLTEENAHNEDRSGSSRSISNSGRSITSGDRSPGTGAEESGQDQSPVNAPSGVDNLMEGGHENSLPTPLMSGVSSSGSASESDCATISALNTTGNTGGSLTLKFLKKKNSQASAVSAVTAVSKTSGASGGSKTSSSFKSASSSMAGKTSSAAVPASSSSSSSTSKARNPISPKILATRPVLTTLEPVVEKVSSPGKSLSLVEDFAVDLKSSKSARSVSRGAEHRSRSRMSVASRASRASRGSRVSRTSRATSHRSEVSSKSRQSRRSRSRKSSLASSYTGSRSPSRSNSGSRSSDRSSRSRSRSRSRSASSFRSSRSRSVSLDGESRRSDSKGSSNAENTATVNTDDAADFGLTPLHNAPANRGVRFSTADPEEVEVSVVDVVDTDGVDIGESDVEDTESSMLGSSSINGIDFGLEGRHEAEPPESWDEDSEDGESEIDLDGSVIQDVDLDLDESQFASAHEASLPSPVFLFYGENNDEEDDGVVSEQAAPTQTGVQDESQDSPASRQHGQRHLGQSSLLTGESSSVATESQVDDSYLGSSLLDSGLKWWEQMTGSQQEGIQDEKELAPKKLDVNLAKVPLAGGLGLVNENVVPSSSSNGRVDETERSETLQVSVTTTERHVDEDAGMFDNFLFFATGPNLAPVRKAPDHFGSGRSPTQAARSPTGSAQGRSSPSLRVPALQSEGHVNTNLDGTMRSLDSGIQDEVSITNPKAHQVVLGSGSAGVLEEVNSFVSGSQSASLSEFGVAMERSDVRVNADRHDVRVNHNRHPLASSNSSSNGQEISQEIISSDGQFLSQIPSNEVPIKNSSSSSESPKSHILSLSQSQSQSEAPPTVRQPEVELMSPRRHNNVGSPQNDPLIESSLDQFLEEEIARREEQPLSALLNSPLRLSAEEVELQQELLSALLKEEVLKAEVRLESKFESKIESTVESKMADRVNSPIDQSSKDYVTVDELEKRLDKVSKTVERDLTRKIAVVSRKMDLEIASSAAAGQALLDRVSKNLEVQIESLKTPEEKAIDKEISAFTRSLEEIERQIGLTLLPAADDSNKFSGAFATAANKTSTVDYCLAL